MTFAMGIVVSIMLLFSLTGSGVIKLYKHWVKDERVNEDQKHDLEMFLEAYNGCNFVGRVNITIRSGAIIWSSLIFPWMYKDRQE